MDFSRGRTDPRRHLVGIAAVVLLHILIVYGLVTGLAKKVVEAVRAPIETKVIEEVKKPPPPPEVVVPPPPRLDAPPPPFIPPPEVQIATPPPPQPTIAAVTPTPPPSPVVISPPPPPTAPIEVALPPAPPPPPPTIQKATVSAGIVCPNYKSALLAAGFPRQAARASLDRGSVFLKFTLGPSGKPQNVIVLKQSHAIFGRAAAQVVADEVICDGPEGQVVETPEIVYSNN